MALAGVIFALSGCALFQDDNDALDDEFEDPAELNDEDIGAVAYETRITGVPEADLRDLLRRASQLVSLENRPPPTVAGLRRRASDDAERLRSALHSEGFYASEVAYAIDTDRDPVRVNVEVETGNVYLLSEVRITYTQAPGEGVAIPREAEDIELEIGMRGRAPRIVRAQRALLRQLENNGHPFAEVTDRRATVDHEENTLQVRWRVNPGPFMRFDDWMLEGLETVEEEYLRQFRTWDSGEPYDQRKVSETRSEMMATRLFDTIGVERGEPVDDELPLIFSFEERAHRSIGFTARFSTSEGPSGQAFWEHRNFFGENEQLRLALELGLITQELRGQYRKPRFLRPDQDLTSTAAITRKDTDAFTEEAITGELGLERIISPRTRASLGGLAQLSRSQDQEGERNFLLFGIPARLMRDTRDDVLNPAEGTQVRLETTPFAVLGDETELFLRNSFAGAGFYAIDSDARFVLAGRGLIGSIVGARTTAIPPSRRFFAGGGGSIRGFPFEEVGPLDEEENPLGGRSVIEVSTELRIRVTNTIGIVPFIDGGNVFDEPFPKVGTSGERQLRFAGGLGFRYFTPVGPVRVDFAFPINRREGVDNRFEFYISLGQAF